MKIFYFLFFLSLIVLAGCTNNEVKQNEILSICEENTCDVEEIKIPVSDITNELIIEKTRFE